MARFDGTYKTALQQTDIIIVDIDIGKYIVKDSTQHITGREEFLYAFEFIPSMMVFLLSGSFL